MDPAGVAPGVSPSSRMCGVPQTTQTTATKNVLEWAAHGEKREKRWKEMGGDVRAAQNLWDMHTIDEKIKFEAKGYTREGIARPANGSPPGAPRVAAAGVEVSATVEGAAGGHEERLGRVEVGLQRVEAKLDALMRHLGCGGGS